jgi:hypothetical protein
MMKSRALLFLLLVMGLALAACVKSREQPVVGGETNWLKRCTDQGDCGAGSCLCGVCTTECSSALTCSGDFAGSCVETTSPLGASACAGAQQMPVGLCLPGCGSDAECGAGFACRHAVCVTEAIAQRLETQPQPPDESDADVCRAAERCGLDEMCNMATARAQVLECYRPFAGPYAARCGGYDSIVFLGYRRRDYLLLRRGRSARRHQQHRLEQRTRLRVLRRDVLAARIVHCAPAVSFGRRHDGRRDP